MAFRYILFHKPYGVVAQFSDRAGRGHRTLRDYVPVPGVYPVGRLDKDSEGLLLLTDDGAMQHRLSHPKFEHEKTYWVQVEGSPSDADLEPLRGGILIQDYRTLPARAALIAPPDAPPRDPPVRYRASIPDTWLEITLREGRNRQVRRMTAAAGFPTLRLIRISVGPLQLAGMKPGEWRDCTQEERNQLTRSARSKG